MTQTNDLDLVGPRPQAPTGHRQPAVPQGGSPSPLPAGINSVQIL
jgi:hypothetical protein